MDRQENRLQKTRLLISQAGGQAAFADILGMSASQVSQFAGSKPSRSIGNKIAARIEEAFAKPAGWLDWPREDAEVNSLSTTPFDVNVVPASVGKRRVPLINYVQAGQMTEIGAHFSGEALEYLLTDLDLSEHAFALEIQGDSMAPEFSPGDRIIVDQEVCPRPGDFVVARNGGEEATFKKYRPRGINENGQEVFELTPLNPDYPTLRSDRQHLAIIGVMVEHRRYRKP